MQGAERLHVGRVDGSLRTPDGAPGSIHQIGALMGVVPACNGWEHWYYRAADGQLIVIDVLHNRLRSSSLT